MPLESSGELLAFGADAHGVRYGNYVSVFFVTSGGVILVDPCGEAVPRLPRLIREAIGLVTEQPVRTVVYSHWGSDHARGGAHLAPDAQFVAHKNAGPKIVAAADPNSPPATILIDAPATVELGDTRVDLYPTDFWAGDDYLIVHEPRSKLVMTVDFVQRRTVPFRKLFGIPSRIVERLQWLDSALDYDYVISGHSQPVSCAGRADVLEQRQYYLDLGDAVSRANGDPAAARAALEPSYGSWRRFPEMVDDNIAGYLEWSRTE
jgi:glyoxylase-like metal-dependent hydrolase (beta-lactamase superfamily II)